MDKNDLYKIKYDLLKIKLLVLEWGLINKKIIKMLKDK